MSVSKLPLFAELTGNAKKQVVNNPIESAQWATHMLDRASAIHDPTTICETLADRVIRGSGCFGGIETPIVAKSCIVGAHKKKLAKNMMDSTRAVQYVSKWTIEINKKCIEELLSMPSGPQCVFGDILQFTEESKRKMVGLDGGRVAANQVLRKHIPWMKIRKQGWCYRHDEHDAGPHCTDHSRMGLMKKMAGNKARFLYVWVAIVRNLRPKIIYQENVIDFGDAEMRSLMGDIYVIIRVLVNPDREGWSSLRARQVLIMILLVWQLNVIREAHSNDRSNVVPSLDGILTGFNMDATVSYLADRTCNFTWAAYLVATEKELQEELVWALSRKAVQRTGSATHLHALTKKESKRWKYYQKHWPDAVGDVGQMPEHRPLRSRGDKLHTLIRNNHLMMIPSGHGSRSNTWFCPSELFTSMGFPITREAQQATGAVCNFSRGTEAPSSRTPRSQRNQIGNAMHTNSIGKLHLAVALKVPTLGVKRSFAEMNESKVGACMGEFRRSLKARHNTRKCMISNNVSAWRGLAAKLNGACYGSYGMLSHVVACSRMLWNAT
eukprot:12431476-Karenia_brevis.AAC.1